MASVFCFVWFLTNSLDWPLSLAVVMNEARSEWAEYLSPRCSFTSTFTRRPDSQRRDGIPVSPVLPRESDTNSGLLVRSPNNSTHALQARIG